ncbi:MAG: vWA domain-containing protein, partial [Verrucomicrobiota bacterium]
MKQTRLTLLTLSCLAATQIRADEKPTEAAATYDGPLIQVALLLDTSTSMEGLLDQARTRMWELVTELTTATRDGRKPRLEVGLYEYGSAGYRHLRQVKPLSDDLDGLSEKLFELDLIYPSSTKKHPMPGGAEYCGQVIQSSLTELRWSQKPNDVKIIFIAGNEAFTQGPVEYLDACKLAIGQDVVVNTIFCGDWQKGYELSWQDGALKAEGAYFNINQDQAHAHIDAPQDAQLGELNEQLNATYIAFSSEGQAMKRRQIVQDRNASGRNASTLAGRAYAKASSFYQNESWDLVDACANATLDLADV